MHSVVNEMREVQGSQTCAELAGLATQFLARLHGGLAQLPPQLWSSY